MDNFLCLCLFISLVEIVRFYVCALSCSSRCCCLRKLAWNLFIPQRTRHSPLPIPTDTEIKQELFRNALIRSVIFGVEPRSRQPCAACMLVDLLWLWRFLVGWYQVPHASVIKSFTVQLSLSISLLCQW